MSKVITSIVACAIILSGCAKSASNVTGAYQSPAIYASWTCEQLDAEEREVRRRVAVLAQTQDNAATRDAVAMGVGLVLFWPALFLLAAGDDEAELSQLKGQHEALVTSQTSSQCPAEPAYAAPANAPMVNANADYPAIDGPRPVEGARLSSFSDGQMNAYCAQDWEERVATDGRSEFNPCKRKDEFI
jgi:hypothetical protein